MVAAGRGVECLNNLGQKIYDLSSNPRTHIKMDVSVTLCKCRTPTVRWHVKKGNYADVHGPDCLVWKTREPTLNKVEGEDQHVMLPSALHMHRGMLEPELTHEHATYKYYRDHTNIIEIIIIQQKWGRTLTNAPFISLKTTPLKIKGDWGSLGFSCSRRHPSCLNRQ